MAKPTLRPERPGTKATHEPLPPENIGDDASATSADAPQTRRDDMNMMSRIPAATDAPATTEWEGTLARTRVLRAKLAKMLGEKMTDAEYDPVDREYRAFFDMLVKLDPPTGHGLAEKMEIAAEIYEGFEFPESLLKKFVADAKQLKGNSLILILHARYEAAWAEYNRIDAGQPPMPKDPQADVEAFRRHNSCEDGMRESFAEAEMIRRLILWQAPSDYQEASILSFHLWGLNDCEAVTEEEKKAVEVGLTNLFDFLVGEGHADMEETGRQFLNGALIAFNRRRYRTGLFPED